MSKKSKRVDKETRQLMESISDLVKKKGDRYRYKTKSKKQIKKIKKSCPHWIYRKGREIPVLSVDPEDETMWRCKLCGARFPIRPLEDVDGRNAYQLESERMLQLVNQIQFWSIKLGGDADDTRMFLKLKDLLPRFSKVSKQIVKRINKREQLSNTSKNSSLEQFNSYSSFGYH